jgi:hypothetical protein
MFCMDLISLYGVSSYNRYVRVVRSLRATAWMYIVYKIKFSLFI